MRESEHTLIAQYENTSSELRFSRLLPGVLTVGLLLNACGSNENSRTGLSEATLADPNSYVYDFDQDPAAESDEYIPDLFVNERYMGLPSSEPEQLNPLYKQYEREYGGSDKYLALMEARVEGDSLVIKDVSPEGADQEITDWFAERIVQNPLAETMLRKGGKITFALDDDEYASSEDVMSIDGVYGYYVAENKELVFEISTHSSSLSAEVIDQYLTHEATHMLFGSTDVSVFSEESKPQPKQLAAFRAACNTLRTRVLEGVKDRAIYVEQYLERYVDLEDDPNGAARYRLLIEYIKNGEWTGIVPTSAEPMLVDKRDKVPECVVAPLGVMQNFLGESHGLPKPAPYDSSVEFDDEAHDAYSDAQSEFQDLLREVSLYSILTEGSYIHQMPSMGHPHDGLDELAASTLNILVTYPEELADNLRYISETEQTVVCDMMRLVIDTVVAEHPDLSGYLSDREAVFLEELNK